MFNPRRVFTTRHKPVQMVGDLVQPREPYILCPQGFLEPRLDLRAPEARLK